ncbi:MAG TPA: hypothetical protein VNK95_00260, partial [Caldilineaceae bacterium]|nr:hypothetical protein [Caldilineaceae bacterium]
MAVETGDSGINHERAATRRRDQGIPIIAAYHFLVAAFCLIGTIVLAFLILMLGVVGATEDTGAFIGMFAIGAVFVVV